MSEFGQIIAIGGGGLDLLFDDLTPAIAQFKLHGMIFRKAILFIEKNEGEVDAVSRTPNPTLAVDIPFESFGDLRPANIKVAYA